MRISSSVIFFFVCNKTVFNAEHVQQFPRNFVPFVQKPDEIGSFFFNNNFP